MARTRYQHRSRADVLCSLGLAVSAMGPAGKLPQKNKED